MKSALLSILLFFVSQLCHSQTLDNYDTCRTQLYYQHIGSDNKETYIAKARTVQDNGIVNAGYSKQPNSQNAILIKQNIQGQVIWQKEYGNNDYDEQFTDWRELTNRQLLLSGTAKNRLTQQSLLWLILLTEDGNIIWQKTYADVAPTANIKNVKIYQAYSGEYFFAAETDGAVIYGMTNNTGNINWQQSLVTTAGTRLVAASAQYDNLLIVTGAVEAGYSVANLHYINYYWTGRPKTVRFSTKLGGAAQNAHYILHDYEQYGQYTYFSGIRSVNNAPFEAIRLNINQGHINEALETINAPGITLNASSRTSINIYGDVVSFTATGKSDQLHAIKLTGSNNYPTEIVWSSSYRLPDSIILGGNIKTWDGGYNFFGFKELAGSNKKIIQLKTDSASLAASCITREKKNFTVSRNPFPQDTVVYSYNSLHVLTNFNYLGAIINAPIDTIVICKELKCPVLPATDSCLNSFQKLYESYNEGNYSAGIQTINGRTFISGMGNAMDYVPYQASFIAEINKNGQVIHQKNYVVGIGNYPGLFKGVDSSLLLYGSTLDSAYYNSIFLAKVDTNLNVLWMKSLRLYTTPQYSSEFRIGSMQQASDGSYFLFYSDGVTFGEKKMYLTKLSSNGDFLWTKVYRPNYPGDANVTMARKLVIFGGHVYMLCVNAYNAYSSSILIKVTENNGALVWCKKYSNAADHLDLSRMFNIYTNELYLAGVFTATQRADHENILVKMNPDGNILSSVSLKDAPTNFSPAMTSFTQHPNGKIYMGGVYFANPPLSNRYQAYAVVNSNFEIINSKKRMASAYITDKYFAFSPNEEVYETGEYILSYNSIPRLFVTKYDPNGNVGTCASDTLLLQRTAGPVLSVSDINCPQSDTVFAIRTPVYRTEQFFLATSKLLCASVPGCNFLDVTGSDSICDRSLPHTFKANRNPGCAAPLEWIYDNSQVQLLYDSDSTITFKFLTAIDFLLKARFTSNCILYTDSMWIHVPGDAPVLNLGADTSLCAGATLLLNAKKGFRSYSWQDGSTDSVFAVTTSSLYYVTVSDFCNNFYKDSINVVVNGNATLLNLGPDTSFCNSNNVVLTANAGFVSYQWQDGSTGQIFTANTGGLYHVSVTDLCGNIFRDTIVVHNYRKASTLYLGKDTIFCNAGSLSLNAGAGFKQYRWQDGSTDSLFLASTTGLYYVDVIDSCGLTSTDSIRIEPDNVIDFDLGADTSICAGDTLLLQVTQGLKNYTWSPRLNMINKAPNVVSVFPGVSTNYHVSAIKQNGCLVKDSILINVNIATPINLGADTRICSGDSLLLNADRGFSNYLWSTGELTSSIYVHSTGLYYVSATDSKNCRSRDTLLVPSIIPLPVTELSHDSTICIGQSKTLKAGGGFASYLWNTGAQTDQITISSVGNYWVTVTNSAGCKKKDSVQVTKILPLPSDFIEVKDSVICNYESIRISPTQNYADYLWSTGSRSKSITATDKGVYWLQVTDYNGCRGIDSFTLSKKECVGYIYFPNSFTPNSDGHNDTYRATAYGRLDSYHMIIYNRYGEKVFESRNVNDGWNGEFRATRQSSTAFVWTCSYKFTAGEPRTASGSVILIR